MRNEQCYLLPIVAIIESLKGSPERVSLQAHLPALPGLSREACLAEVVVGQGLLSQCTIVTQTGHCLSHGQEALARLQQLGPVEWRLVVASSEPSVGPPVEQNLLRRGPQIEQVPRRNAVLLSQIHELPFELRRVWLLVDGTRTVEELASLLGKSPSDVFGLLLALQGRMLLYF